MLIGVGGMWDDCLSPPRRLLQCSSSEWAVASQKSLSFFSTICSRSGPSTEWNSHPAHSPTWLPPQLLTFEICAEIMVKIIRAWCGQVRSLTWHLTCSFFFTNVNTNIRQCRLHFCPNNYFRRTKKCMVNFLATLNRWLNTLDSCNVEGMLLCYNRSAPRTSYRWWPSESDQDKGHNLESL